jgi:hypothetical protein
MGWSPQARFGPKTARALSKYRRARAKRRDVDQVPNVWLAERGARPLLPNGIKSRLKRLGLTGVHAHRWRHNFAHEWHRAGGNTGDLIHDRPARAAPIGRCPSCNSFRSERFRLPAVAPNFRESSTYPLTGR